MLDRDLGELYGVETKVLNQAEGGDSGGGFETAGVVEIGEGI